jgi:hypothetical protein
MVNPAAFIILLTYTCSTLLLLPQGGKWGSHAHSLYQIWPSIPKRAGSWLPCRGRHTQHHMSAYHTFASTSQPPLFRKHVHFKPTPSFTIAMPTTLDFAFSPTLAMAKCGTIPAADPLVASSVTSFSTKSGVIPQHNLALLSRLQELPIHAPPSVPPNRAGIRASTKTEIAAECRLAKEAKQKAAKDKKLAAVARKAMNLTKKQERLISSAKSKAAMATAKADKLCLKLAKVTMAGTALAVPHSGNTSHSHKKSKGFLGTLSITSSPASPFLQSPQRKGIVAKKRVSIQLPLHSTSQRLVELVFSCSYSSSLDGSNCPVVGEDSNDKSVPSFELPGDPSKPSGQGSQEVAHGGLRYASPLGQCRRVPLLMTPPHDRPGIVAPGPRRLWCQMRRCLRLLPLISQAVVVAVVPSGRRVTRTCLPLPISQLIGVERSAMASGQALTTSPSFPISSLSILQGIGWPTSSLLIGQMPNQCCIPMFQSVLILGCP